MRHLIACLLLALPITAQEIPTPEIKPFILPTQGEGQGFPAIDVYRLASIINGEAIGEPHEGKILVAEVAVNRAGYYKETVAKTIGRGFDGLDSKYYYPTPESVKIAKNALQYTNTDYLYFLNPDIATDTSFIRFALGHKGKTVGNHYFF